MGPCVYPGVMVWLALAGTSAEKQTYQCYRIPSAVRIDGELDDSGWAAVPEAAGFWVPGAERFAVERKTTFRMGWDERNLYLAVRCTEPKSAQLRPGIQSGPGGAGRKRPGEKGRGEGLYFDNSIELFVMPERPTYYRVAVNAAGRLEGPSVYKGAQHAREEVRATCESAAVVGKGEWRVELRVPLSAFGRTPRPGDIWDFNVCRNVRIKGARADLSTTWARLPKVHWHLYDEYAKLRFRGDRLTPPEARAAEGELNREFAEALPNARRAAVGDDARRAWEARLKALPNLCGGEAVQRGAFRGETVRKRRAPPNDLVIVWREPVTFDALLVNWESEKAFATQYGLEYWDEAEGGYRLLVEERDNRSAVSIHRFEPVRTRKARFAVFAHPLSLVIRHFGLYRQGTADVPPQP